MRSSIAKKKSNEPNQYQADFWPDINGGDQSEAPTHGQINFQISLNIGSFNLPVYGLFRVSQPRNNVESVQRAWRLYWWLVLITTYLLTEQNLMHQLTHPMKYNSTAFYIRINRNQVPWGWHGTSHRFNHQGGGHLCEIKACMIFKMGLKLDPLMLSANTEIVYFHFVLLT